MKEEQETEQNYMNVEKIYNTHQEMIADVNNLTNNDKVKTLGYFTINDGGSCEYYITDVLDNNCYQENLNNGLYARMIITNNVVTPIQFGCIGDGQNDDSSAFFKCLSLKNITIDLLNKEYSLYNLSDFTFKEDTSLKNGTINIDNIIMRNANGTLTLENVVIKSIGKSSTGKNQKFLIFAESGDAGNFIIRNSKILAKSDEFNNKIALVYLKDYINCIIENSYFENQSKNTEVGGCIWLSATTNQRNQVIIRNNTCINNSKDEVIGIYDNKDSEITVIENNYIESKYDSDFTVTFYRMGSKNIYLKNNTIKSHAIELSIDLSNECDVEICNNIIIHDCTLQSANNRSGIRTTNTNVHIYNNSFYMKNTEDDVFTSIPFNVGENIVKGCNILWDVYNSHNACGNALNRIDCYYQNLYSIYGKYYNSTIRTEALKLVGNIEACNCNFNTEQAVSAGYADKYVIFKNCNGGIFINDAKTEKCIIENSSITYCYGNINNPVNSQIRLNACCDSGYIHYSSINNVCVNLDHMI